MKQESILKLGTEKEQVIRKALEGLRESIIELTKVDCFHEAHQLASTAEQLKFSLEPQDLEPEDAMHGLRRGPPRHR